MATTHSHHKSAADHHEKAAQHHREAAKFHEAGNHEKGGHHAQMAHGRCVQAVEHGKEASKSLIESHGTKK